MTNEAFLQAIAASPDDEALRLVYADWLEDHGDDEGRARAELIRAQCELAKQPTAARRTALARRARELLEDHARQWAQPLRRARLGTGWQFRRGFPEAVTLSARRFVAAAERLFALAPTLRAVRFPDASNEVSDLAACSHLARLREVDLSFMCRCGHCPIEEELHELFASPHVANLTRLVLSYDRLDADGARALASSPHLARLTTLDLAGNPLGAAGARALLRSPHLTRLEAVDLSTTSLGNDGAGAIAEAPRSAGLRELVLRGNAIGAAGARALAGSANLAGLRTLDLLGNRIGETGARALASSPHLDGLRTLDVRDNDLKEKANAVLRKRFGRRVKL